MVAAPDGRIRFGALRAGLTEDFFGRVRSGAYAKAVKNLAKAGKLDREQRKAAALTDGEYLSLAASGHAARSGKVVPIRAA